MDRDLEQRQELRREVVKENSPGKKHLIEDKLSQVEDRIAKEVAKDVSDKVKDHVGKMNTFDGKFSNNKMWKLKRKICPKNVTEVVTAKKDNEGVLVTNPNTLQKLYLK